MTLRTILRNHCIYQNHWNYLKKTSNVSIRTLSQMQGGALPAAAVEPATTVPETSIPLDPLKHPDYFGVHKLFTVKDLFDARVHLGHKEGTLHENMKQFMFGKRLGHLIFDLDQTAYHLREALNFTAHIAYKDGIILFVNRMKQTASIVDKAAEECQEYSHTKYWQGGLFTNSTKQYGGITRLPDLLVFFNTLNLFNEQHVAVRDAAKMLIPTVGIVDSNCDPNIITYPVPGNDDTPDAIQLYCKLFKEAILLAKAKRKEDKEKFPAVE